MVDGNRNNVKENKITVSVVIPAYNEGARINERIRDISEMLNKKESVSDYELIIIDDGSSDNTKMLLKNCNHPKVRYILLPDNHGKGHALRTGALNSRMEYVAFFDADKDLPVSNLSVLIDKILKTGSDGVICSKMHPESKVEYPLKRRVLSRGYYFFVNMLFNLNVSDTQVGAKIFKKEVLDRVMPKLLVKKFAFDVELLSVLSKYGYKVTEAPVVLTCDKNKFSTVSFSAIVRMFIDTCAIAYRHYIRRWYDD